MTEPHSQLPSSWKLPLTEPAGPLDIETLPSASPAFACNTTASANRLLSTVVHAHHKLIERLARVTSSGLYLPEIDGLRFLAITGVFFLHVSTYLAVKSPSDWDRPEQPIYIVALLGRFGVQLFFVVSGFILGMPFASHYLCGQKRVSLRSYFLRRITRLEPPYLINLTILLLLLHLVNHCPWEQLMWPYVASCLYLHNATFGSGSMINSVVWSLEVEVQFYILAPLLARLFAIQSMLSRRLTLLGLIGATTVGQGLLISPESWAALTIFKFLPFFVVGFLIADIYLTTLPVLAKGRLFWEVLSFAGWIALIPLLQLPFFETYLLPIAFLPLFLALFQSVYFKRLLTLSWVTTIGGMCYTIYLFHFVVISSVGRFTKDIVPTSNYSINLVWQTILLGVPVLVVSALYFVLVEKPCMRKDWPGQLMLGLRRLFGSRHCQSINANVAPCEGATDAISS